MFSINKQIEDASTIEIKRAYKKLARVYHPDKLAFTDDQEAKTRAEDELIKINNAKDILLDPEKREKYDSKLKRFKAKSEITSSDLIENIDIEWDAESFSADVKPEENPDYNLDLEKSETIYQPDFRTIQRRFLTFCPNCGEENLDGSEFCHICNASMLHSEAPVPPRVQPAWRFGTKPSRFTKIFILQQCPYCGAKNFEGLEYCIGCRASLIIYPHESSVPQTPYNRPVPTPAPVRVPEPKPAPQNLDVQDCPRCGAKNLKSSRYCQNCYIDMTYYSDLTPPSPPQSQPQPPPNTPTPTNLEGEPEHDITGYDTQECPHCGAKNPIGNGYCYSCYQNLGYHKKSITHRTKTCPRCGVEVNPTHTICRKCGFRLPIYR